MFFGCSINTFKIKSTSRGNALVTFSNCGDDPSQRFGVTHSMSKAFHKENKKNLKRVSFLILFRPILQQIDALFL